MKLFPSFTRNNCSTLISFCRHNELLNSGFLKSNYLLSTTVRDIESQSSNDWPFKVPFRKSKMLMVVASRCERLKSPPFLAVIQTKKVQVYSDFFFWNVRKLRSDLFCGRRACHEGACCQMLTDLGHLLSTNSHLYCIY